MCSKKCIQLLQTTQLHEIPGCTWTECTTVVQKIAESLWWLGCVLITVARWVSVFLWWEGKWQTKQALARHPITLADNFCTSCEKMLGMNMCRTIKWDCYWFIYEPENVIHSLKVSKCILIGYQIICQRYTYTTCGNCWTAFEFLWMWIWNLPLLVNIKVKCSCYRPGVAQRVGRGIALLFHDRGTRRWVSGKQHALAALYPRERPGTHFTGGWVSPRAGLDGRKISSLPGFDPGPSSP
jgi:hypothetical protein